ncbi:MAG: HugZ family protein [Betaproteobacteria bacterium]
MQSLLREQRIAALGTLHAGEPYVSMVPFALLPGGRFVVHVSALAAHTKDMLEHAQVSLLVVASPQEDVPTQGMARVTIQGEATQIAHDDPEHAAAKSAYLARFPESEPMFGFGDFSLFAIEPRMVRFVGGFAQAKSLTPDTFAKVLH